MDLIAEAVSLVESSSGHAHVIDTATVRAAKMVEPARKILIGVKSKWTISAVKGKSHVRELVPVGLESQPVKHDEHYWSHFTVLFI